MKFGILVAFSCQKRNQFFALTHREQLFKNQESITTTKIVRQNGRLFELWVGSRTGLETLVDRPVRIL